MVKKFLSQYKLSRQILLKKSSTYSINNIYQNTLFLITQIQQNIYEAQVRFGTWVRVQVVWNSTIFEKGGCRYGGTQRLKNY